MVTNAPEWLRFLGYLMAGGAVPDERGGLTPWMLARIAGGVVWGGAVGVVIFLALNSHLREVGVGHHILISLAAVFVYAVVAIGLTVANGLRRSNG